MAIPPTIRKKKDNSRGTPLTVRHIKNRKT